MKVEPSHSGWCGSTSRNVVLNTYLPGAGLAASAFTHADFDFGGL